MSTKLSGLGLTKPAITDTVQKFVDDTAANMEALDRIWPVGSIYLSASARNPGEFLGGVWTRIEDRFLVAAGAAFPAGSTGGQADMGIHKSGDESAGYGLPYQMSNDGYRDRVMVNSESYTGKILPPYVSVYAFQRTA